MNSALSENAPAWQCPESRQFIAWYESDEEDIGEEEFKQKRDIPDGYVVAKEYCEQNIISYRTVERAKERGKIPYIIVLTGKYKKDKILCIKPQDIENYMKRSRKRGRHI